MHTWKLQDAKARFSEVVKEATTQGPQEITLRGEPVVVVMSIAQYSNLVKPKLGLAEFMRQSPLFGVELNINRPDSLTREIDL
jgi:antitoxin Phd